MAFMKTIRFLPLALMLMVGWAGSLEAKASMLLGASLAREAPEVVRACPADRLGRASEAVCLASEAAEQARERQDQSEGTLSGLPLWDEYQIVPAFVEYRFRPLAADTTRTPQGMAIEARIELYLMRKHQQLLQDFASQRLAGWLHMPLRSRRS